MGGMFRSTENLRVVVRRPILLNTNVAGGDTTYSMPVVPADVNITVTDPGGIEGYSGPLSGLPSGNIGGGGYENSVVIEIANGGYVSGLWLFEITGLNAFTDAVPEIATVQWGGAWEALCAGITTIYGLIGSHGNPDVDTRISDLFSLIGYPDSTIANAIAGVQNTADLAKTAADSAKDAADTAAATADDVHTDTAAIISDLSVLPTVSDNVITTMNNVNIANTTLTTLNVKLGTPSVSVSDDIEAIQDVVDDATTTLAAIKGATDRIGLNSDLSATMNDIQNTLGPSAGDTVKALLGTPTGVLGVSGDIAAVKADTVTLLTHVATVDSKVTTVGTHVTDIGNSMEDLSNNMQTIMALLTNSVFFDGTTSTLYLFADDGSTVICHWLCYQADGVTLATTISQVAKRGPVVLGP